MKRMPFLGVDTRKLADRKIACENCLSQILKEASSARLVEESVDKT
jgi:hypothetical protein